MAHLAFPPNIFCIWPVINLQSPLRLLDALSYDYGLNPFISNPGGCSLAALQLNPLQCPQGTDLKGKRGQMVPVFRKEGRHGNLLCHTLASLSIAADLRSSLWLTGSQEAPPPTQSSAQRCYHTVSKHVPSMLDVCWDFGSRQTRTRIQMPGHIWVLATLNSRVAFELSCCAFGSLFQPCHLAMKHHESSNPLAIAFCIHSWRRCSCKSKHGPASFSVLSSPFLFARLYNQAATSTLPTCRHNLFLSRRDTD